MSCCKHCTFVFAGNRSRGRGPQQESLAYSTKERERLPEAPCKGMSDSTQELNKKSSNIKLVAASVSLCILSIVAVLNPVISQKALRGRL